jgi:transcriptional regulator with XRE-family HTH domain
MKRQNGAAIRAIRTTRKIGVRELARRLGCSHGFVCNVEAERAYVSAEMLRDFAVELDVPVAAITRDPS